jgi:hypothetical protein
VGIPRHKNGAPSRKRRYARTTAVGRVLRNLAKGQKILALVRARFESWGALPVPSKGAEPTGNSELLVPYRLVMAAVDGVDSTMREVVKLEKKGWAPPKKSWVVVFVEGDEVEISDKHRTKYLEVYGKDVIADLIVSKVLPSGELAVRHGQRTPFIVAKSHLARRSE